MDLVKEDSNADRETCIWDIGDKMKKWLSIVVILSVFGISLFWGIGQNAQKEEMLLRLENEYQRSFFDLATEVAEIDTQLAKVLVTADRNQLMMGLSNLWRSVYGAMNALAGVPIAMYQLENIDTFLHDVARYSYYLMEERVLEEDYLEKEDWTKLEEFYRRAQIVGQEISALEAKVLNGTIQFTALSPSLEEDNIFRSAFQTLESKIGAFPKVELEEGVRKIEPKVRGFGGQKISAEQAVTVAEDFFELLYGKEGEGYVEFVSEQVPIPVYGVAIDSGEEENVYIEISQHGGHVLQLYGYRDYGTTKYTVEEGIEFAENMIKKIGLKDMALIECQDLHDSIDVTFVSKKDGVYIYADMVKVLIALDNGQLIGFDQSGYISYHYERELPQVNYSAEEILATMNPNFIVEEIRLALLTDEYLPKEYLTYELRGRMNEERFAIFVDAQNKKEKKIVRLTPKKEYEFILQTME